MIEDPLTEYPTHVMMKTKQELRGELLNAALSDPGVQSFFAVDQKLVTNLCEIIGAMHRELEAKGMTDVEIKKMVEDNA